MPVQRALVTLALLSGLGLMPAPAGALERTVSHGVVVVRGAQPSSLTSPSTPTARPGSSIRALAEADCAAAENGDADAAYRTARRFLFGIGARRDHRVGVAWLRAAATRGHGEARKLIRYVPGGIGRIRPWCRAGAGPLRGPVAPPEEVVRLVRTLAPGYGLDPSLVLAVIQVESAFRTDAVSPKEAAGLMQLIPETAERFAVRDVFDPEQNIRGGMGYLRWLLAYFQGDVRLTLAAYNAGEGAVDRYAGIPPYDETRSYVRLVQRLYPNDRHVFNPAVATPSPRLVTR